MGRRYGFLRNRSDDFSRINRFSYRFGANIIVVPRPYVLEYMLRRGTYEICREFGTIARKCLIKTNNIRTSSSSVCGITDTVRQLYPSGVIS